MRRLAFAPLIALALVSGNAHAEGDSPAKALLRYKWVPGQTLRYVIRTQTDTASTGMPGGADGANSQSGEVVFTLHVEDVDPTGRAVVTYTSEVIRIESTAGDEPPIAIASDDDKPADSPQGLFIRVLVGKPIRYSIAPTGEVLGVSDQDQNRRQMISELTIAEPDDDERVQLATMIDQALDGQALKALMERVLLIVPGRDVSTAESWSARLDQPIPVLGSVSLSYDSRLVEIAAQNDAQVALIESEITLTAQPVPSASMTDGTGFSAVTFDPTLGQLVSSATRYEFVIEVQLPEGAGATEDGASPLVTVVSTVELHRLQ